MAYDSSDLGFCGKHLAWTEHAPQLSQLASSTDLPSFLKYTSTYSFVWSNLNSLLMHFCAFLSKYDTMTDCKLPYPSLQLSLYSRHASQTPPHSSAGLSRKQTKPRAQAEKPDRHQCDTATCVTDTSTDDTWQQATKPDDNWWNLLTSTDNWTPNDLLSEHKTLLMVLSQKIPDLQYLWLFVASRFSSQFLIILDQEIWC